MSQLCYIKDRGKVYETDYEEVKSECKKGNILLQNNVRYQFIPAKAPESSKDNPLVILKPQVWIKCDDEEVNLETFEATDTIAKFCGVAKEYLDVTLEAFHTLHKQT